MMSTTLQEQQIKDLLSLPGTQNKLKYANGIVGQEVKASGRISCTLGETAG